MNDKKIVEFLTSKEKEKYLIFGGRAFDLYYPSKIKTKDWDILLSKKNFKRFIYDFAKTFPELYFKVQHKKDIFGRKFNTPVIIFFIPETKEGIIDFHPILPFDSNLFKIDIKHNKLRYLHPDIYHLTLFYTFGNRLNQIVKFFLLFFLISIFISILPSRR